MELQQFNTGRINNLHKPIKPVKPLKLIKPPCREIQLFGSPYLDATSFAVILPAPQPPALFFILSPKKYFATATVSITGKMVSLYAVPARLAAISALA